MPYLQRSDELKIFYTLHGEPSNPPILLVHGWSCDQTDWIFTIPALLEKYYVIALDLRGHGHSSSPTSITYTIKDFASDAIALLEELKLTKNVIVMGHSMGGIVASSLTALYPEFFKALVIVDPPYWRTKAFWKDMLPKWDELQNGFVFVTMAFGNQLPPEMPPWMMTWYGLRGIATAEHVIKQSLEGAFAPDMLGQQEAHTQLVKDRKIPRLGVYMTAENVENEKSLGLGEKDKIVQLADAGHWLFQMKPDEFNEILTKWLETV